MAMVDYLTTGTVVAKSVRDGSRTSAVNSPMHSSRTRWHRIHEGAGAELECPDCRARPRRSRRQLLDAADTVRAAGGEAFYIGDQQ